MSPERTDPPVLPTLATGPIVVGHDGSRPAGAALDEALVLGRALATPLVVVRAWLLTTSPQPETWAPGYVPTLEEFGQATDRALAGDIEQHTRAFSDVPLVHRAVHGNAGAVLVEAAEGAGLLVVGARGHGGLSALLLGSVSDHCVRRAPCSVLVVRQRDRARG